MHYYPKIQTLYERDDAFKVTDEYRNPVFGNIKRWLAKEKVDGTNMSIFFGRTHDGQMRSVTRGRTPAAQKEMFQDAIDSLDMERLEGVADTIIENHGLESLEIFGEAYGAGIQSGGWYAERQKFVVYDMRVNGAVWLDWFRVVSNCAWLDLESVPVCFLNARTDLVSDYVRNGFRSALTDDGRACEGVVCLPSTGELTDHRGNRVIWKLKHKDFAD